jgi:hypothetical protein
MKLSLRARAALQYFVNSDITISAERLSQEVTEGREAIRTAMKELRDAGLIMTRKERVNSHIVTVTYVTEAGFLETESWAPKTRLQIQQNSNINIYANSALNIKNTTRDELGKEEPNMGYEFFSSASSDDSDLQDAKRKDSARRQAEYDEAKQKAHDKKTQERLARTTADWTLNQLVNYFSQEVNEIWGLKPWSLSGSKFLYALGASRKKHGTNAEVEKEMMDIFFSTLKTNAQTDSSLLWKLFLSRFSELEVQARLRLQAPEKLATAVVEAEDSWKGL